MQQDKNIRRAERIAQYFENENVGFIFDKDLLEEIKGIDDYLTPKEKKKYYKKKQDPLYSHSGDPEPEE